MAKRRDKNGKVMESFKTNPYVEEKAMLSNMGTKIKWIGKDKNKFIAVGDYTTGEVNERRGAVIGMRTLVDSQQFVKIYAGGIAALFNLPSAGRRVFAMIYEQVQKNKDNDHIILPWDESCGMSRQTFYAGLKACLNNDLIAQSNVKNVYWINIAYFFNGYRVTLLHEYGVLE